jgi:hypothetical protein
MDITHLFVSQRKLRNPGQVPALVEAILQGDCIPPIRLTEAEDGTIQVDDGHHRLVAYWLSGRTHLRRQEYRLIQADRRRPAFGRVADLLGRIALQPSPASSARARIKRKRNVSSTGQDAGAAGSKQPRS